MYYNTYKTTLTFNTYRFNLLFYSQVNGVDSFFNVNGQKINIQFEYTFFCFKQKCVVVSILVYLNTTQLLGR